MTEQRVRTTLSEQVQTWASGDRIERMLNEIEGLEKKARLQCPHCKKISYVEVADDVRKLEALLKVIEQTEGKPGTVEGDSGGITLIVERSWPVAPNGTNPVEVPAPHTADNLSPVEGES